MQIIPAQNIASTQITATATATALFSLINTAGSVTNSQAYALTPTTNGIAIANGVLLTPEDYNISIGFGGLVPTAANGFKCIVGNTYFIPNVDLANMKLIRTAANNVKVHVELCHCQPGEIPNSWVDA